MQKVLLGGFLIMGLKIVAYFLTHSNAVLTDENGYYKVDYKKLPI